MKLKEKKVKTEFGYMYRGYYIERQNERGYNFRRGDWLVYPKNYWEDTDYDTFREDYINCDVGKTLKSAVAWIDKELAWRESLS